MLTDNFQLKKKDLWHFVASLIILATIIPYMLTSWSEKMRVASGIIDNLYFLITYDPTSIHKPFRNGYIYLSRDVYTFLYLIFTIPLFVRYFRHSRKKPVLFGQGFMIKWLIVFQFFFFLMVAGHILVIFRAISYNNPDLVYAGSKVQLLASIGLIGLLISPFFFPEILYGLPRIPDHYTLNSSYSRNHTDQVSKKRKARLESEYLDIIRKKTNLCMEEQQPFLRKDFNITELSVMIHIPVHHLSYFFREEMKQSFTNYRNHWRIEYAKKMIQEGKAKELTLEAI